MYPECPDGPMCPGPAYRQNGAVTTTAWLRGGTLPPLSRRGVIVDALLAVAVGVFGVAYALSLSGQDVPHMIDPLRGPPPVDEPSQAGPVLVALAAAAPLAARRMYPLAVLWAVIGATLVADRPRLTFVACVVAAYSAVAYSPHRMPTYASLGAAALAVGFVQDSGLAAFSDAYAAVPTQYAAFLILAPIVLAAHGRRALRERGEENRTRLAALERERAEAVRRATEQERARIARELHDVVTHNVSVMVIQAGAARSVLAADPEQAREALLAVEAGGRAAMAELRHVMGLLTPDTAEPGADLAPQPGLDRVATLVDRVRDTGVAVDLVVTGQPPAEPLPSGIGLTAYRVVQEGLTNTVKHAAGAGATVTLEYAGDHLRVEVTDTGGRPAASAASGDGHGLMGLRERLAVYGGTLDAGHRPTGGFRVSARIPLETA